MSTLPSDTQSDPDEINLLDLLQVVAENLRLLVLGPLAVGLIALGITFLIRPTFTATTVFLPPQQQQSAAAVLLQSLGALGSIAGAATGLKNPNDQYVSFLKSRHIQDKLIERFKLKERYEAEFLADTRKELESNSKITSGKDGLISVAFDDVDPVIAAQVANAYTQELGNLMEQLAVTEAQQRRVFFEAQLIATKNKLTKAEQALGASGVNSSALKSNPQAAVEVVARVQAEIAAQEVKVSAMRSYLADSAPSFKQAMLELSALRAQLQKLEANNTANVGGDSDYVSRFRDFKYYETLFELFAKQFELAKVDESREGAVIQVLDVAKPPEKKSKPKKGLVAVLTTLASGVLLLIFVFARSRFRVVAASQEGAHLIAALSQALRGKK
jgi:tyrosine-protein kinase Etk/Wzc